MSSCLRTRRRRLRVLGGLAHGREITGSRAHDPTGVSQGFVAFCLVERVIDSAVQKWQALSHSDCRAQKVSKTAKEIEPGALG